MSDHPRIRPSYRVQPGPRGGVFLMSERGHVMLRGSDFVRLVPLLDGRHTVAEIVARMSPVATAPEVYLRLEQLDRNGLLARNGAVSTPEQEAWWELSGADDLSSRAHLEVAVEVVGDLARDQVLTALRAAGVMPSDAAGALLVVTDDYLRPELASINAARLASRLPWMLARPTGREALVGPVFSPGESACWQCLAERMRRRRRLEDYLLGAGLTGDAIVPPRATIPASVAASSALIALAVVRWLSGAAALHDGALTLLDTAAISAESHAVVRRPQCPACGSATIVADAQMQPPRLLRRSRTSVIDGGHRAADPSEVVARFGAHVSRVAGVISEIRPAPVRGAHDGVHCYSTDHNFVHAGDESHLLRETLRGRSGGKGTTDAQARASAIGESLERYSGVYQGDEARLVASAVDLGDEAIDPRSVMLFSDRQYDERERWNEIGERAARVPERFDPRLPIEWSPVWSPLDSCRRLLPTACCYFGYAARLGATFADADSNGCAAGSSLEEAVLQGALELVERDAVAIWWYNRLVRPAVDLESFSDSHLDRARETYRALGRSLHVLDLTHDLGIPVCAAVSRREDHPTEDIILGFGAHLDPRIAVLRAVTEMHQSLAAVHPSDRVDGEYLFRDGAAIEWWRTATFASEPYLVAGADAPLATRATMPDTSCAEIVAEIEHIAGRLASAGMGFYVLDQTRPDIGLSVVRVIAPGLRHFWPRYAPGRLYSVPVEVGWLAAPRLEADLNPRFIYF